MESKGIFLGRYDNAYFCKVILDTIIKDVHFFDKHEIDQEVIEYIKTHDVRYVMMGFPKEIPDIGKPIISVLGDPPRKMSMGERLGKECKQRHINAVVTQDECCIEPLKELISPYIPDIEVFYYTYGVDFDYMKDYGLEKDIEVSNMGKLSAYKYRRETHITFSLHNEIDYRYLRESPPSNSPEYYIRFGNIINRSLFSLGGCQQEPEMCYYKDKLISTTFPKNIEICACRSALLTTEWGDREFLGFEDGVNCILFKTPREAVRKVEYYLKHREELQQITDNGYELVHKNHNIKESIPDLIKRIEKKYL